MPSWEVSPKSTLLHLHQMPQCPGSVTGIDRWTSCMILCDALLRSIVMLEASIVGIMARDAGEFPHSQGAEMAGDHAYRPRELHQSVLSDHVVQPSQQYWRSTPGEELQDRRILGLDVGRHGFVYQVVITEEMQLPAGIVGLHALLEVTLKQLFKV